MTYNVVDQEHGVVQVEGEVMEIEGVMCGLAYSEDHVYVCFIVTELRTGARLSHAISKEAAITFAKAKIRSVEFGPAMVRTKSALAAMGIEYPVNKV